MMFVGLDVHKKQWTVTIRNNGMELRTFSMNPSPEELRKYLDNNYPGGLYYSVYEAGFCGYWIHRRLIELGIMNIIVNPADTPVSGKEKAYRNDFVDSRKLARELEKGNLKGNYIPEQLHQELRSLCRLRWQLTKDLTRLKNRTKGLLLFYGHHIPEDQVHANWSGNFLNYLDTIKFKSEAARQTLSILVAEIRDKKLKLVNIIRLLKKYSKEYGFDEVITILLTVPGIGFITAVTLYTELIDINRFQNLDSLCNYVGLVPSVDSTDQREYVRGLSFRHSKFLRNLMIESAWIAVRKDPALTASFNQLTKRMKKQKAIIRITKKLLNRIMYVWKNKKPYVRSVVK
jgi:transposase